MKSFLMTRRYRIKLLSPLHIGGGNVIPFYQIFCDGDRCYIFDETRFGEALAQKGHQFVERFIQFAQQERGSFAHFLKNAFRSDNKSLREFLESAKAYSLKAKFIPRRELHSFIRNPLYQPYIPGSSIKGALRTAMMYLMLKRMDKSTREKLLIRYVEEKLHSLQNEIGRNRSRFFKEEKRFDQELELSLMWKYFFDEGVTKFDPHSDIMRAIKISDTQTLDPDVAQIEEIEVYTRKRATGIKIYVEVLPPGAELEFSITVDMQLLLRFQRHTREKFGLSMNSIAEMIINPFETLGEWAGDLLEYEQKALNNPLIYHFSEKPNINLGWGGGLLSKTVDLLLPERLRAELLSIFKNRTPYVPAPASRRLTRDKRPLGWAKIEEI